MQRIMDVKKSSFELKKGFIDAFSKEASFTYTEGNPFCIKLEKEKYFIFVKNISSAYYPKYPDITRVQLPFSEHFEEIGKTRIPFFVLGYDSEHESFTGWEPKKTKSRLNAKSNVSLFSRNSFQEKLHSDIFKVYSISNGDKVVVFSKNSLPKYFRTFQKLFDNNLGLTGIKKGNAQLKVESEEKICTITDKILLKKLDILLKNDKLLTAVDLCANHYQDKYPKMNLKDWFNLVESIQHG